MPLSQQSKGRSRLRERRPVTLPRGNWALHVERVEGVPCTGNDAHVVSLKTWPLHRVLYCVVQHALHRPGQRTLVSNAQQCDTCKSIRIPPLDAHRCWASSRAAVRPDPGGATVVCTNVVPKAAGSPSEDSLGVCVQGNVAQRHALESRLDGGDDDAQVFLSSGAWGAKRNDRLRNLPAPVMTRVDCRDQTHSTEGLGVGRGRIVAHAAVPAELQRSGRPAIDQDR